MKKRFCNYAAGAALFLLFLFSSAEARQGAADGLRLWGTLLVPSLLPYFAAAGLLTRLGAVDALARRLAPAAARLFGVSGAGAAVFLLGLSGGYPLGAARIGELYRAGAIQHDGAGHLPAFCDNSGPAFAVGALGAGVFGSAGWGLLLWGVHALSAAAVGILFRRKNPGSAPARPAAPAQDLGADKATVFFKTTLPLSLSGICSGITMVFIPTISTYAISQLLSNGKIFLFGDSIQLSFEQGMYGVGSIMSIVMLIFVLISNFVMNKFNRNSNAVRRSLW